MCDEADVFFISIALKEKEYLKGMNRNTSVLQYLLTLQVCTYVLYKRNKTFLFYCDWVLFKNQGTPTFIFFFAVVVQNTETLILSKTKKNKVMLFGPGLALRAIYDGKHGSSSL